MKQWSQNAIEDLLILFMGGVVALAVIGVASFPVWAYHFNLLSFEWVVVVALTLILLDGGSE